MTNKLALFVAVALGILSILSLNAYVDKIKLGQEVRLEKMTVMVAARDIAEGQIFTEDDIETAQFPRSVIEQALRNTWVNDKSTILGTRTKARIKQGQILLTSHFQTRVRKDAELRFGKDQRAISIPISRTGGLVGMLKPQDTIDIIVSMSIKDPAGRQVQVTHTLLQGVQILATDSVTSAFSAGVGAYSTITVALSPRDCNRLLFALSQGAMIQCALTQEGTTPYKGSVPVIADDLYREIAGELGRWRPR
ncbi:MAG: Flp pilus assembly protein CpaB [Planctomycetota bacterium]|nr:MAG: Flp pilus assembly protein CpaB [Planctomycetota bacterium]